MGFGKAMKKCRVCGILAKKEQECEIRTTPSRPQLYMYFDLGRETLIIERRGVTSRYHNSKISGSQKYGV